MGAGIAVTALRGGHSVLIYDVDESRAREGVANATRFLDRSVQKGKLPPPERDQIVQRLAKTLQLGHLSECGIVIEAVPENLELKRELLRQLDDVLAPDALIHTNTSTLPVTAIAAGSRLPERVVGTHYCNPAPLMDLVELVPARQTSDDSLESTRSFLIGLGKRPIVCKDVPGFIVNRYLVPFENDCIRALEAGIGTVESIDLAIRRGLGYPMGTFRLLDIVGLDVHRAVSMSLYEQLRDVRFAPPPLVDQMIDTGHLGRKSGRGFYTYDHTGVLGT
jgi:3-hydroxybutyryl-CoA dehydrogenase